MTFRLEIRRRTRQEIDAHELTECIRAPMNASPQPVEIVVPVIDVLNQGGGHQGLLALLALVRDCFDPEGYEATIVARDPVQLRANVGGVTARRSMGIGSHRLRVADPSCLRLLA
jgi:hypothetical protein